MDNFENEVVEEVVETEVEETVVETNEVEETEVVEETQTEETSTSEDGDENQEEVIETNAVEKFTKTFTIELSHDDIRYALYNLIAQYEEEDNEWYGIRSVYDSYFYMQGWCNNKLYKVGYEVDGENVGVSFCGVDLFLALTRLKVHAEQVAVEVIGEIIYTIFLERSILIYPNGIGKLLKCEDFLITHHICVVILAVGEGIQNLGEALDFIVSNAHGVQYFIPCFAVRTLGCKSKRHIDRYGRNTNI